MAYIDMNMVRAGALHHSSEWKQSGYNEIQEERIRYSVIDMDALKNIFDFPDTQSYHNNLVYEIITKMI
ncbi:MAG: hypothetical protein ACQEQS_07975 [Thermodesulfobacteriota bacterium]